MQGHLSVKNEMSAWWMEGDSPPRQGAQAIDSAVRRVTLPVYLLTIGGLPAVAQDGTAVFGAHPSGGRKHRPLEAYAPPLHPQQLGALEFRKRYSLKYNYVVGAMANGITSVEMVSRAGRAGMVGFFGSAGLAVSEIDAAISRLQQELRGLPFGLNLIHSPNEPQLEAALAELYLRRGIRLVSASAYMDLTLPLVYYRVCGIHRDADGRITCPNRIIAKVSRVEVARKFLSPPPAKLLSQLLEKRMLAPAEAEMAARVPMASDLTAEADSGGHTDNRPALALLPTMLALRDELTAKYRFAEPINVGLAGGIATPEAVAAAFAAGAAYVLTGSVNQACIESGTSASVRQMLAEAGQADVVMAPAADMFELGVKVQVLKRGTMFPLKAARLYDLYVHHDSLESITAKERAILERDFFRCSLSDEWEQTKRFFMRRDPGQIELAEKDPKHKMALVFRSYLGCSSSWANSGEPSRRIDYQIWCGPSIGAFNEWVRGSFLEKPENRKTETIALNLLYGAAVKTRFNWLRWQGALLPDEISRLAPLEADEINALLR